MFGLLKVHVREIGDKLCINNLLAFTVSLLKEIAERTGLHVFMIVRGPMLKKKGELGTLNLSWSKNLEAKSMAWPNWNEKKFKESIQDFFLKYLQTAYTAEDWVSMEMPGGTPLELLEAGLYVMDEELKGPNQNLDKVSDSLSEEESDDPGCSSSPVHKHKHWNKSMKESKGTRKTQRGKAKATNNDSLNKKNTLATPALNPQQPKLSTYELQWLANIAAIKNDLRMIKLKEEAAHKYAERHLPHPKSKSQAKKVLPGEPNASREDRVMEEKNPVATGGMVAKGLRQSGSIEGERENDSELMDVKMSEDALSVGVEDEDVQMKEVVEVEQDGETGKEKTGTEVPTLPSEESIMVNETVNNDAPELPALMKLLVQDPVVNDTSQDDVERTP
ncbi:hypothetical protein ARMGADRAFT_1031989 [Armillaria gallica]|uniref:Uncharacterized protein n=1 Tax=Armillaria gallica TaxID=47427 RepID=A0A2H3D6L6_ARMGA|nr:hypothetical protein ARMGADRAFT_1031989 [Armillaria gallica]